MRFRQHEQTASQTTLQLLALFALVVAGLVLAVNGVLALIYRLTFPFVHGFPALFFETNSALVLLFVLGGCWIESLRLREGGVHVARLAGGREAQVSAGGDLGRLERRFAHTVQEMVIASGHSVTPAAWVLPRDDAINALAAGWGGSDAVVAVTRGALERLTRAELQGVVAHEFSHLVHGDTRLNMRLVGLVWGLQMIWGLGLSLWASDDNGRRGPAALFGLGLMAVGSLGWAAGRLLQAAVSRQREFLADASAVKYTRAVDGLGGALRKIAGQQLQGRTGLQSAHAASLAHLLLENRASTRWRGLWQTHPPLAERLRRLYGHEVLPLSADVVALEPGEGEESQGVGSALHIAPTMPIGSTSPHTDMTPEAQRHDAFQRPTSFDAREREREALARIERWHGPGEWQAAMLALAIAPAAPDAGARWEAWLAATADLNVAAAVRREVEALGPAARRQVFTILMQRARSAAPGQGRAQWRALRRRWALLPPSAAAQWQALALRLLLSPRATAVPHAGGGAAALERHARAAHAASSQLARVLDAPGDAARAWLNAAAAQLGEFGAPAPRGPTAGLAPLAPQRQLWLALRVRRVGPMQRPLLIRAWLRAAEQSGLGQHAGTGDALYLACLLLDVPLPEVLTR